MFWSESHSHRVHTKEKVTFGSHQDTQKVHKVHWSGSTRHTQQILASFRPNDWDSNQDVGNRRQLDSSSSFWRVKAIQQSLIFMFLLQVEPNSGAVAENVALALSVVTLFVLCEPRHNVTLTSVQQRGGYASPQYKPLRGNTASVVTTADSEH